ncbi:ribonuclease H-like domain-containing protein, partial [Tanacetum coccineum]
MSNTIFGTTPSYSTPVRIKLSGDVFRAKKLSTSSQPAIVDPQGDITVPTTPPKRFLIHDFIGSQSTKMPMNFMGPFPSSRGNKYILVAVNYLFKWVEAKALPTSDARVVVKFLKSLFARFGTPRAIISDRGTHFCNDKFAKLMSKYEVTHRLATVYHPQTSSQVEVSNHGLKRILERTVGENRASWSDRLDDALWAFCTAYKTPIGCTLTSSCMESRLQLNELNELRDQAYENSLIYKERTKKLHDSKIKNRIFNVGDQVLLFNSRLKIFSGKLKTRWYVVPTGRVKVPAGSTPSSWPTSHIHPSLSKEILHYCLRQWLCDIVGIAAETVCFVSSYCKDNVIVSAGRSKVIPAGRTILVLHSKLNPVRQKDEYKTWAMKMEYWIMNSDHNLWNIVLNGNSWKKTRRDPKGNIMILPPVFVEEHIAVQRETKARTILLQSLPEDHMADFHHLDDARDIWLAVKARFGGNDESKKMRKSMLKQEFLEFRISESEGLHKGYDRFQKILSQLNQMQAKPDNEDCNMKFLRALPPSWSQVAITLKTKGGLDYLSFDDLYNKLRTLEIDVKGGSSYDSRGTSAPTHSAFISAASTNSKMSYADSQNQSPSITFTTASSSADTSSNVIESVLHSFVAESDPQQQITYEDFDQIGKLDLEELDIKWQMAMLSVRINRFEKKAGRKMKFNNRDAARFDKKKVKCYKCSELGHFARECTGKQLDSKARYSAFKLKELDKSEEPKALLSVDSMLNWSDHEGEDEEKGAAQVYGMIAGDDDDAAGDASGDVSDAAAEFALMGLSSQESSNSKTNEHLASASSSVDFKTVSKTADQKPSSTIDDPSFSLKENVKPPR